MLLAEMLINKAELHRIVSTRRNQLVRILGAVFSGWSVDEESLWPDHHMTQLLGCLRGKM
jgi:hypothetical protein